MNRIIAIVGMAGAGKSVAASALSELNLPVVHFGDATQDYLKEHKHAVNEKNERAARELLRKKHGMAAFAILNAPKLAEELKKGSVVADGLYSWEEYLYLKKRFGKSLCVVAIYASPRTRHSRLKIRVERPLTHPESATRDQSEIENLNKAGPIAMADYIINNEGNIAELQNAVKKLVKTL